MKFFFASIWSSILFVHQFFMKELVFMRRCKQSLNFLFLLVFVDLCAWGCKKSEIAWMQWEQEGVRFSKSVCENRGTMNEGSRELLWCEFELGSPKIFQWGKSKVIAFFHPLVPPFLGVLGREFLFSCKCHPMFYVAFLSLWTLPFLQLPSPLHFLVFTNKSFLSFSSK